MHQTWLLCIDTPVIQKAQWSLLVLGIPVCYVELYISCLTHWKIRGPTPYSPSGTFWMKNCSIATKWYHHPSKRYTLVCPRLPPKTGVWICHWSAYTRWYLLTHSSYRRNNSASCYWNRLTFSSVVWYLISYNYCYCFGKLTNKKTSDNRRRNFVVPTTKLSFST